MSDKLLDSEVFSIDFQDDVDSFPHRSNYANIKNRHNALVDTAAAASIGTTNAETTAARPYHIALNNRLDQIADQLDNVITNGGAVTESTVPDLNVDVAAVNGTVGGIQNNITSTSVVGPFVAPTNKRYVVICLNSDNTLNGELSSDVADPILPNVGSTQRPLAYFLLDSTTTAITNAMITDCREQGLTINNKWFWQISDAITTLNQGSKTSEGYRLKIHKGTYIEEVDYTGYFNLHFDFEKGTFFKKVNGKVCFKNINTVTNETFGNKITGCNFVHDGTVPAEKFLDIDFDDRFLIEDCQFDGTADNIDITNCDKFTFNQCDIFNLVIGTSFDWAIINCFFNDITVTGSDRWNINKCDFNNPTISTSDDWTISYCNFNDGDIDTGDGFKVLGSTINDLQADTCDNFIWDDNVIVGFDIGSSADCSKFRLNNNVIDDYSATTTISSGSFEYLEDGFHKGHVTFCGTTTEATPMLKKGWFKISAMGTRFLKADQSTAGTTAGAANHQHTISGTTAVPSATKSIQTGTGDLVAVSNHTHFLSFPSGTATHDPLNYTLIPLIHR